MDTKAKYVKAAVCSLLCFVPMQKGDASIPKETSKIEKKAHRSYRTFNYPALVSGGQTLLTGIRGVRGSQDEVYISGFYNFPDGNAVVPFVYKGPLSGEGSWHVFNFPSSFGRTVYLTNLYGPNNGHNTDIQVVGNYKTLETGSTSFGCLYQGDLDGCGKWTTLVPTSSNPVLNTIAHSTMGGLVVGNYSTKQKVSRAFIYDIKTERYHEIIKPGAKDVTAYGIWHDGGSCYTICGGYSDLNAKSGVGSAYIVNWNNRTRQFSDWRNYSYQNGKVKAVVTHFDGITSDGQGGYHLTGDWIGPSNGERAGFYCEIKDGNVKWSPVSYPGKTLTSGNSIYKKVVIGSYLSIDDDAVNGYISF